MSKVITVSRTFPAYHSRKGQPTYFREKIWKSLWLAGMPMFNEGVDYSWFNDNLPEIDPKQHTIRAGKRWKDGDMASLREWSDMPYRSQQIAIAPDVQLAVKDIEIDALGVIKINFREYGHMVEAIELAKNDGLSPVDFLLWIGYPFSGQILIWNKDSLTY